MSAQLTKTDQLAGLRELARHLRVDFTAPDDVGNDHLIFSKGHASPLLYALFKAAGAITDSDLLSFRARGSRLEGHPTPRLPWVDVATGSLGQGLPVGVGLALAGRLDRLPYRIWVLCGDSELAEGSMWEAFEHAGHERLDHLTAIVDVNRLGQRGPTRHGWDTAAYARRIGAFGWHTLEIDGHDPAQIDAAYAEAAATGGRPTAILARTKKGKGVAAVEDREGFHGKPLKDAEQAIDELGGRRQVRVEVARSPRRSATPPAPTSSPTPTRTVSWSATSPSSRCSPPPSGCRCADGCRMRRPSPRSGPAPTTSCGWPRSAGPTCGWSAHKPGWRSARTARPRWAWKTWPPSGPCTAAQCSTRATATRPAASSWPWPGAAGSATCAPPAATPR